jgi:hypothetical protein
VPIAALAIFLSACGGDDRIANPIDQCRGLTQGSAAERACVVRTFDTTQNRALELLPTATTASNHEELIEVINRLNTMQTYAFQEDIRLRVDPRLRSQSTTLTSG